MDILSATTALKLSSFESVQAVINGWKLGQILDATVMTHLSPQRMLLRIGNSTLLAQSHTLIPRDLITDGSRIRVQLERGGDLPTLKLITTPDSATQTAMRLWIPRQQPLTQLFADFAHLSRTIGIPIGILPAPLSAAILKLIDALPRATDLRTVEKTAQAIRDSGSFLESKLANTTTSTTTPSARETNTTQKDIKALLLQVFAQLRASSTQAGGTPAPTVPVVAQSTGGNEGEPDRATITRNLPPLPTFSLQPQPRIPTNIRNDVPMYSLMQYLTEQIDAALSRIQVTQLSHTSNDPNTPTNTWTVELPVRYADEIDVVQIRWQQDSENDVTSGKRAWIITLSFDFPETGPLLVYSKLIGTTVSTTFRAERADTVEIIRRELPYLESLMLKSGLTVGQLGCVNQPPDQISTMPLGLIDTHI